MGSVLGVEYGAVVAPILRYYSGARREAELLSWTVYKASGNGVVVALQSAVVE